MKSPNLLEISVEQSIHGERTRPAKLPNLALTAEVSKGIPTGVVHG